MHTPKRLQAAPFFSIGIPTYNRCNLLRQSLESALNQKGIATEIIICDNASTDETQKLCESLDDPRIKYYRNSENIGPIPNWHRCLELATGEYFSWLQDDDLIFPDFASRAADAMANECADAYFASSIQAATPTLMYRDRLYAPPITMNWACGKTTPVERDLIIPLSLFCTVGIPPTIAFRKQFLRQIFPAWNNPSMLLFCERLLIIEAAIKGNIIVAPHIAGIFRQHSQQTSKQIISSEGPGPQWTLFVERLSSIAEAEDIDMRAFQEHVKTLPDTVLQSFYENKFPCGKETPFYRDTIKIVDKEIVFRKLDHTPQPTKTPSLTQIARSICPPILIPILRTVFPKR